jgi:hypothetical protein
MTWGTGDTSAHAAESMGIIQRRKQPMPKKSTRVKLTQSQVSFIMAELEKETDAILGQARGQLRDKLIPPAPTRDQKIEALVKLAYDKPKALARMFIDSEEMPMVTAHAAAVTEAYQQLDAYMESLAAIADAELRRIKAEMLWSTYESEECPLDMYLSELQNSFMEDDEEESCCGCSKSQALRRAKV